MNRNITPGWIYALRIPGLPYIKIGWSLTDWKKRVVTHQISCPVALEVIGFRKGGFGTEQRIHETFKHLAVRTEWFSEAPELMRFIADHFVTDRRSISQFEPGAFTNLRQRLEFRTLRLYGAQ